MQDAFHSLYLIKVSPISCPAMLKIVFKKLEYLHSIDTVFPLSAAEKLFTIRFFHTSKVFTCKV